LLLQADELASVKDAMQLSFIKEVLCHYGF